MKRKLSYFTFAIILVFSLELLSCSKKNKSVKVDDKEKPSKVLDESKVDEGHSSDALVGEEMPGEGMAEGEGMPDGEEMPEGEGLPDDEEVIAEEKRIASEIGDLEKGLSDSEKPKEEE
ncbi:MAG: hypothetical protein II032_06605, partial [Treponema sp.]|nr:hypothetical protein [Treponema sp.]